MIAEIGGLAGIMIGFTVVDVVEIMNRSVSLFIRIKHNLMSWDEKEL